MPFSRYVTLAAGGPASTVVMAANESGVEVLNRNGLAEVFFTIDGTVPTVAGNDTEVVVGAPGAATQAFRTGSAPISVKMISSAATTVGVRGLS